MDVGSQHAISTQAIQGAGGTHYVFGSWSHGGNASQSVTASAGGAVYTASFGTEHLLTTAVNPTSGGRISAGGWIPAGNTVSITAETNLGYQFSGFSGSLSGRTNPQQILMDGPKAVTANFSPLSPLLAASITGRGGASTARQWTITLANTGTGVANDAQITAISVTQSGGATCGSAPSLVSPGLPVSVGDIGPLGSKTATVTMNFAGCASNARFTVSIQYKANGGAYSNATTINNQFQ